MATMIAVGHLCADNICVLDGFPAENTSKHIESVDKQAGGGASQAAVAFSRLGGKSGYLGVVGDDDTGDYLLSGLDEEKVDRSHVTRRKGKSAFSFVCVNSKNATRTLFNYHDRLGAICYTSEDEDYIAKARYLHLDGTMYEDALNAASIAKKHNVLVSLDGSSMQKDNSLNKRLASMADILIMNEFYPCRLMEDENRERAMKQISLWGARIVMSTLGEKGSVVYTGGEFIYFPSFKIEPVDTTGAGDVFHGAFLLAMEKGYDLKESVRFASAVSAINCLSVGGRRGIPSLEETNEFINDNEFIVDRRH